MFAAAKVQGINNDGHQRSKRLKTGLKRASGGAIFTAFLGLSLALTSTAVHPEAIIADHRAVQAFERIPAFWLEKAKTMTIHYAHTSHGDQVWQGVSNLESQYPKYRFARRVDATEGLPPAEVPPALRMYDGNPPETYIEPNDYWEGESGKDRTRDVADTGHYHASMWAWCGQVSGASEAYIQGYLDTLYAFETEYPAMRFIYMTGHLDGGGSTGNLHLKNQQIRHYCSANNKVLFDFADIERYDPEGTDFLDLGADDECDYWIGGTKYNWADQWCAAHPGSDFCLSCACSHSRALNCNMKARAFWWMMARLAGWNGQAPSVPLPLILFD